MHGTMRAEDVDTSTWPGAILALGALALFVFVFAVIVASVLEFLKMRQKRAQMDEVQQLVQRYEQLASTTLDAQQRFAADISELRVRTTSIEQILRSVE
jgi:hypothetical protein